MKKYNEDFKDGILFVRWGACPHCHRVEPTVKELSNTIEITEYVTDELGWPTAMGVQLVPSIIKFKDGEQVDKIEGVLTPEQVKEFIA